MQRWRVRERVLTVVFLIDSAKEIKAKNVSFCDRLEGTVHKDAM